MKVPVSRSIRNKKTNQHIRVSKINKKLARALTYPLDNGWKLDEDRQMIVVSLLAKGFTPGLVKQILAEDYNIEVSIAGIYQNYLTHPKWAAVIDRLRERGRAEIASHPLADKATRLNYLQEGLNEAMKEKLVRVSEHGAIFEKKPGLVASFIREARAEVEGDKPQAIINIDASHKTLIGMLHSTKDGGKVENKKTIEAI